MLYQPQEQGQGLVEYALILVLVAVVVIVVLLLLGPAVGNIFSNILSFLQIRGAYRTEASINTKSVHCGRSFLFSSKVCLLDGSLSHFITRC